MMRQDIRNRLYALIGAGVVGLAATASWSQSLTWLGTLGGRESTALGVSENGVVVGWADDASYRTRAFRWTRAMGMQDLGTLGGTDSWAYGVSADGRVIVGGAYTPAVMGVLFAGRRRQGYEISARWAAT
jgi:probable HAF family extracellular repeat protein